jgi:hypothetical protein
MPKAKAQTIDGLISEEEQSELEMMEEDSDQENQPAIAATKAKGKAPTASRKRNPPLKKTTATKARAAAKKVNKRTPLETQNNEEERDGDSDDADEFAAIQLPTGEESPEAPKRRGRPPKKVKEIANEVPVSELPSKDDEFEYTPTVSRQPSREKKGTSEFQTGAVIEQEPEPRSEQMIDVEGTVTEESVDEVTPQPIYRHAPQIRAPSISRQPASIQNSAAIPRRRAGSTSSNEGKTGDPALRRKLGEMTKKLDALETRYRNLREIGIKEATTNFDQLRTQSDERAKIASDLIASLKKELVAQKALTTQAQARIQEATANQSALSHSKAQTASLNTQLSDMKKELLEAQKQLLEAKAEVKSQAMLTKQLADSKNEAKQQIATLTKQLADAKSESKSLHAKLAASRTASANVESANNYTRTPASTVKGTKVPSRTIMVGSAEAAAAAQVAQLKEDLYSDLTGLIIRGVERKTEQMVDIFDCIQTGRNGSM